MNQHSDGALHSVLCGGALGLYHMAYREWGDPSNSRVLVCVHGLTRNSLDFARLASKLSNDYRVIAPDVVGRGESDRHPDPMAYNTLTYTTDMVTLLARLGVDQVDWLGTSMGGLIGMMLAAHANTPIRRLVLNDVGPTLSLEALKRIVNYVSGPHQFKDADTARRYVRTIFAPFALTSEADWSELIDHTLKPTADGGFCFNYDPDIRKPLEVALLGQEVDLWALYDRIRCATLLIHGETSDLLSAETALEMSRRGPGALLKTVAGVGHAPMFMTDDQIDLVRDFLDRK